MKALFLSAATLLSINTAHADVIKCFFTEPFVSTVVQHNSIDVDDH
ncbi:MAG: hypothetical protein J7501_12655 [Bdellovibrio sp.]|nr:hypothetical protein [Bdellovibrio sp.]